LLCLAPKPGLAPSSLAQETSTRCPASVCVAAKVKVEVSSRAAASRRFIRSPMRYLGYITDARPQQWLQCMAGSLGICDERADLGFDLRWDRSAFSRDGINMHPYKSGVRRDQPGVLPLHL